jgi:hypothetical protein
MPRPISGALQTAFNATITSVVYLVQINGSQIIRWNNGDDTLIVSGVPWIAFDFTLDGLEWNGGSLVGGRLRAQNLDNTLGALFANESMADVTIDIYQVEKSALADPQSLGTLVMDDTTIGLDFLDAKLVSTQSANAKSPRRRVDVYNGFKFALPKGTQIAWGNEIFILEPFNG